MNNDGIMVDAIIADIPYNIGQAKWDLNFDLNELLPYLHKIVKICQYYRKSYMIWGHMNQYTVGKSMAFAGWQRAITAEKVQKHML